MNIKTLALATMLGPLATTGHAAPAPDIVPGWNQLVDGLRDLPAQMIAKLPERLRNDPQTRAEIGRLMLEALAARSLQTISADGNHPVFLPSLNLTLNVQQPNADTTYKSARITPGGVYRLRGDAGSLRLTMLGQFPATPLDNAHKSIVPLGYNDIATLHLDAQHHFDVILSPTRPAGYTGDWWKLDPRTSQLLLRQVAYDWSHERDPTIAIERLDAPIEKPRPTAASLETNLRALPELTANTASFFVDHVEQLRRDGYINKLKVFDLSHLGGLAGQFYYEGAYDLQPNEALIVQSPIPAGCRYRSMILTNDIYETTDWYNNQSSLNGSQEHIDSDGILRIVISAKDPGVQNWLDTAGYNSGAVQGRWNGCATNPIPTVKKVKFADLRKILPPGTPSISPSQRDTEIRTRHATLQQRPLW